MLQDLQLTFNNSTALFDLVLSGSSVEGFDLQGDQGLFTAVVVSLFTDARANADDTLPDEAAGQTEAEKDRRGWWGDAIREDGDTSGPIGSRLWLLWREKDLPAVIVRAQQYAEESLAWLKALGYVVSVSAAAVRVETRHIGISVSVAQAGQDTADSVWVFEYDYTTARPTTVSLGTAA